MREDVQKIKLAREAARISKKTGSSTTSVRSIVSDWFGSTSHRSTAKEAANILSSFDGGDITELPRHIDRKRSHWFRCKPVIASQTKRV